MKTLKCPLLAILASAAVFATSPALAESQSNVGLSGYELMIFDLDATDGIAPSIQFETNEFASNGSFNIWLSGITSFQNPQYSEVFNLSSAFTLSDKTAVLFRFKSVSIAM